MKNRLLWILLCCAVIACRTKPKPAEVFSWLPTECAPEMYPVNIAKGFLVFADSTDVAVPSSDPVENGWGKHGSTEIIGPEFKPVPVKLELTWVSYTENKFFSGNFVLPHERMTQMFKQGFWEPQMKRHSTYDCIVVGMAPGGVVVVWMQGGGGFETEIGRYQAKESNITMSEYIAAKGYSSAMTHDRTQMCNGVLGNEPKVVENLKAKGFQFGLWDTYRERFNIRPVIVYQQHRNQVTNQEHIQFYNGEQDDRVKNDIDKNEFKPLARIKEIETSWTEDRDGKRLPFSLDIKMDEPEIFNAYKQVYGNNPKQQAELNIRIDTHTVTYKVFLQSQTQKVELLKTKGEIYLDQPGQ
jgi:hypothetical protein